MLAEIKSPELLISDPGLFLGELFAAFISYQSVIDIIFSGAQSAILPQRIEQGLKEYIFAAQPEKKDDIRFNILLTYKIQGGYYAYTENRKVFEKAQILNVLEEVEKKLS